MKESNLCNNPLRNRIPTFLGMVLSILAYAGGCASIHPPDGGPPDYAPPSLRRAKLARNGRYLYLRWNEYLSPASQLEHIGLWSNPPLPMRFSLRGKVIRVRIDSLPSDKRCIFLWGGPGIKDFTEGNSLPPRVLWSTCPQETLFVGIPLVGSKESDLIIGELRRHEEIYRFVAWDRVLYIGSLPPGTYAGWAWEEKNPDGRWSIEERVWLPWGDIEIPASDSLLPDTTLSGWDALDLLTRKFLPAWHPWQVDTMPPAPPRIQLPDSERAILHYPEPVFASGMEAFPLSEKVLLIPRYSKMRVADSLGLQHTLELGESQIDTQTYRPSIFWHAQANARTPYLHLRWADSLFTPDTFWIGRKRDSLFIARASFIGREIWLEPLPTNGEVETLFYSPRGDTLRVRLPARKHKVILPADSAVKKWRVYLPPLHDSGPYIESQPSDTLWLPAGAYEAIGLPEVGGVWQPVKMQGNIPTPATLPVVTRYSLRVGVPHEENQ
ncbi:MAG: hypothetical protein ABDH66_05845 [Bacteroidia bacterium]